MKPETRRWVPQNLKQAMLYLLVGSVLLGAFLGVLIVLRGQYNWIEIRVILTTMTLAGASLCGLTSDLARVPRRRNYLPNSGLVLTLVTTLMLLFGIWLEPREEGVWKAIVILTTATVSTVHVSLLSLVSLPRKFKWIQWVAWQLIFGLFALISIAIVFELDSEAVFRTILTVAILDVAATLLVPLMHRIARGQSHGAAIENWIDSRNLRALESEIQKLREQLQHLEKAKQRILDESRQS